MFSKLFLHLLEQTQITENMSESSLDGYDLIPIEQIPNSGFYTQEKINTLIRETFRIDTLGYRIIIAYFKRENLASSLISSKTQENVILNNVSWGSE